MCRGFGFRITIKHAYFTLAQKGPGQIDNPLGVELLTADTNYTRNTDPYRQQTTEWHVKTMNHKQCPSPESLVLSPAPAPVPGCRLTSTDRDTNAQCTFAHKPYPGK